MDMQEGLKALERLLDPYDWFYEVCAEPRRYVVYVHRVEKEQDAIIPDRMAGYQIVVHFASSKLASKEQYLIMGNRHSELVQRVESVQNGAAETLSLEEVVKDLERENDESYAQRLNALTKELDRLERQVGSNTLQDIFYEIHDGKNAVTNVGGRYPDVRDAMVKLYSSYGFDVIYEELDG